MCAAEEIEAYTVCSRDRGTHREALLPENLTEVSYTCLSKDYFHYRDAVSSVAYVHDGVPFSQAIVPGAPAASLDYYVNVDGEAS